MFILNIQWKKIIEKVQQEYVEVVRMIYVHVILDDYRLAEHLLVPMEKLRSTPRGFRHI
jgi:hypothetical protein